MKTTGQKVVDTLWPDDDKFFTGWGTKSREGLAASIDMITGAPDLLAALKGTVEQLTGPAMVYGNGRGNDGKKTGLSSEEFSDLRDARIRSALAAIAKAEGRVA